MNFIIDEIFIAKIFRVYLSSRQTAGFTNFSA